MCRAYQVLLPSANSPSFTLPIPAWPGASHPCHATLAAVQVPLNPSLPGAGSLAQSARDTGLRFPLCHLYTQTPSPLMHRDYLNSCCGRCEGRSAALERLGSLGFFQWDTGCHKPVILRYQMLRQEFCRSRIPVGKPCLKTHHSLSIRLISSKSWHPPSRLGIIQAGANSWHSAT